MRGTSLVLLWLLFSALLAAFWQPWDGPLPATRLLKDDGDDGQKASQANSTTAAPVTDAGEDGQEASQANSTTAEPAAAGITPSLLEEEDFIAKASSPHQQQPFYIMPVFFALKLVFTVVIFGFSINFKPKKPESAMMGWAKWLAKSGAALLFIAMALNGYATDFRRLRKATRHQESWAKIFMLFAATLTTSANFVASQAVWGALSIENPKKLFGLKPKFVELPLNEGIPLKLGQVHFLPPLKHIYALLLLPYNIANYVVYLILTLLLCGWTFTTRCFNLCLTVKLVCYSLGSTLLVIVTLGLWAWPRECLSYWWSIGWPFLYYLLIQAWASSVAPVLFAILYGVLTQSSCEDIGKGMKHTETRTRDGGGQGDAPAVRANNELIVELDEDDRKALIAMNWNDLQNDFEQPEDFDGDAVAESFNDAKIMIFLATLTRMGTIVLTQFFTLFVARGYFTDDDIGYASALYRTAMERSMSSYIGKLTHAGESALEHVEGASEYIDALWRLL